MFRSHHPSLHLISLRNAWHGFYHGLRTQRNLRLQVMVGIIALLLAYKLQFDSTQLMIVVATILLVIGFEMVNTSIEAVVDSMHIEENPHAKLSKDAAAAAVLIISILASIIGLYLYLPPLINIFY